MILRLFISWSKAEALPGWVQCNYLSQRSQGEAQEKEGRKEEKGGEVREIQNVRTQPTIAASEDGRMQPWAKESGEPREAKNNPQLTCSKDMWV